jgi:polyhydroxyalkanoate synthesis regulator phasin
MKKLIRKAILFGMGVASLTREKIEEFVKELEKEGKVT